MPSVVSASWSCTSSASTRWRAWPGRRSTTWSGSRALGCDVYYVEDSGAPPYDPRPSAASVSATARAVSTSSRDVMGRFGLGDRWVYSTMRRPTTHGLSARRGSTSSTATADAIVNLCGATAPASEHRQGASLIYVETDPVYEQIRVAQRRRRPSLGFLDAPRRALHLRREPRQARLSGAARARSAWKKTRPPVVLDFWDAADRSGGAVLHHGRVLGEQGQGRRLARRDATSGRSTSTSCASSTCRGTRRSRSRWR